MEKKKYFRARRNWYSGVPSPPSSGSPIGTIWVTGTLGSVCEARESPLPSTCREGRVAGPGGRPLAAPRRLVARVSRVPGRTGGPWRRSSARCRPASSVTALTPSLTASPLCRPCCRAHPEGDLSPRRPTPGTGISKCSQESSLSFIRCHLPLLCPSAATPSVLHFSCFYLSASHSKSPFIPFLRSHSSEVLPVIVPAQKPPPCAWKLTCYKLTCIPTCFPFECRFPVAANDLIQHPCSPVVGFLWSIAWSRDSGCPRIT